MNKVMIKATLFERHASANNSAKRLVEKELDVRYFSSMEKFQEWYNKFKVKLWEDDKSKVDMVEGIYVRTEEIVLDNTAEPKQISLQATFRNGVSYYYAA